MDRIQTQSETIERQKEVINEMEDRIIKLELQSVKNNILVRGLTTHAKTKDKDGNEIKKETPQQSKEQFLSLLGKINAKDCGVNFATRFAPPKKGANTKAPGVVLVQFHSQVDKGHFFQQLAAKAKDANKPAYMNDIRCENQLPASLLRFKQMAEKKAAEIRKDQKKKTRIMVRGAKLILEVKEGANFVETEY